MASKLVEAARSGDLEALQAAVNKLPAGGEERKKVLNEVDGNSRSLLHEAAQNGKAPIIAWLLSQEGGRAAGFIHALARDVDGWTALHLAAAAGHLDACKAIAKGYSAEEGREIMNAADEAGRTALHRAMEKGHVHIITWLLSSEEGGGRAAGFNNVLAVTVYGYTALQGALQKGNFDVFRAIVNGCNDNKEEQQLMLNTIDEKDDLRTLLHHAAAGNQFALIQWLLSAEGRAAGFDTKLITARTKTALSSALHVAITSRKTESLRALLSGCTAEERASLFLCVDKNGWTGLHLAARIAYYQTIPHLLAYPEASLIANLSDSEGQTPLHRAITGNIDEDFRRDREARETIDALFGKVPTRFSSIVDPNVGVGAH